MNPLALTLFWACVALVAWVYVLYPFVVLVYGRLKTVRPIPSGPAPALVTVGIAVHDGAAQIRQRITDVLAQQVGFPIEVIVASDGSADETSAIVRSMGADDSRVRLVELPRSGQSAAQSAIFEAARGDIVVLTDIETRFSAGCLAALVAPFGDRRVGCVTGVLRWHYDQASDTARHEGLYWRYEQRVRAWESRAGWLSAGTGALLATRRLLFRTVPAHASLDQMLPLIAREQGALVLVAGDASASDRGTASLEEQFASRARIATQGIEANLRMTPRVAPWRRPGSFLALWSHKLLRWASPFLGLVAALAGVWLWADGGSISYLVPALVGAVVGALAAIGYVGQRIGRAIPLTGFPLAIVAVNLAFAVGWLNVLLRRRVAAWDPNR